MKYNTGKSYGTTYEELSRREILRNNLKRIEIQNAFFAQGLVTYTLGINEYADMVSALIIIHLYMVWGGIGWVRGLHQIAQFNNICFLLKIQN